MGMKGVRSGGAAERQRITVGMMSISFGLGVWMMGCSTSVPMAAQPETTATPSQTTAGEAVQVTTTGQTLPIAATVNVSGQTIQLEVAQTPEQQAMGLMFRTKLDADRGMLFPFTPARPVGFWMKDTLIGLDMVFLRNGKVVAVASNVPPCKIDPCPVYGPQTAVDQVIELRGGRAKELGIKTGDRLNITTVQEVKPAK